MTGRGEGGSVLANLGDGSLGIDGIGELDHPFVLKGTDGKSGEGER